MKKTALILSVSVMLAFAAALVAQQQPAKGDSSPLGTWELVSTKYGYAKEFSDFSKKHRKFKMITATYFTWVDYDAATKKISSSAGGPYTLRDGVYTETIEFAGEGMHPYLGKKQDFTLRVEGDKLYQSGQLSAGMKLEEVWQRVK
jgi:hypothetical protein